MGKKLPKDFEAFLEKCDTWIREGDSDRARKSLARVQVSGLPRNQLPALCRLWRRTGLDHLTLRTLKPIVRPRIAATADAFAREKIEYALALNSFGAFGEAQSLLAHEDLKSDFEAIRARGFSHMFVWDYELALAEFDRYLTKPGLDEYDQLITRVNRLACLQRLDDFGVEREAERLLALCKKPTHHHLKANILEILSQHHLSQGRWKEAGQDLKAARKILEKEGGHSALFVEKWLHILSGLESGDPSKINEFRAQALKRKDWETMRDLDGHQTRLQPDCRWANMAYFGTPFMSFRRHLEKIREFPQQAWIARELTADKQFDPWFGEHLDCEVAHRLMVFLLRDLYRPVSGGEIFNQVYPDQYFDTESSPARVRQALVRLKQFLQKADIPLVLNHFDGTYSLRLKPQTLLLGRKRILRVEKTSFMFERFADLKPTTIEGWSERLKASPNKTYRWIREGIASGTLKKAPGRRFALTGL